jgi:hypothetical protein
LQANSNALWKADRIRVFLGAAPVEHRGEVGAAAEPPARRHHHAGVHVHGRHVRVLRMGDQRNARRPEARVFLGAGIWLAELRENSP